MTTARELPKGALAVLPTAESTTNIPMTILRRIAPRALRLQSTSVVPSLITDTRRSLAELASADEFEALATAVLRAAEVARHLQHNREYFGIDYWFNRREEELWGRGELLRIVGKWARLRGSEPAVGLLCEALTQFGERRELGLLERLDPTIQATCADKIMNCTYDVRRRSLGEPTPTA